MSTEGKSQAILLLPSPFAGSELGKHQASRLGGTAQGGAGLFAYTQARRLRSGPRARLDDPLDVRVQLG